jgi:hypothetical protein
MATRKTASASNKTARATVIDVEAIEVDANQTHSAAPESDDVHSRFAQAYDDMLKSFGVGWTRRNVAGLVVGLIVSCGAGLMLGKIIAALTLAVLMVSGSMFLAGIIYVLGLIVSIISAGVLGNIAMQYVASGTAERHVSVAKGWVTGLFGRKTAAA